MSAHDIYQGKIPATLAYGNTVADEIAGAGAQAARVPATDRQQYLLIEQKAFLVRMRLLRTSLEALEHARNNNRSAGEFRPKRQRGVAPQQPPAPRICALFQSQHSLAPCGPKCTRCRTTTTQASRAQWMLTECFD
eukprot:6583063-Pyramimonas_sp.AAC.1